MSCASHAAAAHAIRPIVSVNGTLIAHDAISLETQNHPAASPIGAWTAAARALILRELLLQRAAVLGLTTAPHTDEQGRRETDEEALLRAVIDHDVAVPEADETTCRRYYEKNPERFQSAEILEVSHILVAARPAETAAYQAARGTAIGLLETIKSGRAEFAVLALQHSACPSRLQGGSLGQISAGDTVPEFESALVALEPGDLHADAVATRYGFHIVRLDRRIAGRRVPFAVMQEKIAAYLDDRVRQRALTQYARILFEGARIVGFENVVAPVRNAH